MKKVMIVESAYSDRIGKVFDVHDETDKYYKLQENTFKFRLPKEKAIQVYSVNGYYYKRVVRDIEENDLVIAIKELPSYITIAYGEILRVEAVSRGFSQDLILTDDKGKKGVAPAHFFAPLEIANITEEVKIPNPFEMDSQELEKLTEPSGYSLINHEGKLYKTTDREPVKGDLIVINKKTSDKVWYVNDIGKVFEVDHRGYEDTIVVDREDNKGLGGIKIKNVSVIEPLETTKQTIHIDTSAYQKAKAEKENVKIHEYLGVQYRESLLNPEIGDLIVVTKSDDKSWYKDKIGKVFKVTTRLHNVTNDVKGVCVLHDGQSDNYYVREGNFRTLIKLPPNPVEEKDDTESYANTSEFIYRTKERLGITGREEPVGELSPTTDYETVIKNLVKSNKDLWEIMMESLENQERMRKDFEKLKKKLRKL